MLINFFAPQFGEWLPLSLPKIDVMTHNSNNRCKNRLGWIAGKQMEFKTIYRTRTISICFAETFEHFPGKASLHIVSFHSI